MRTLLFLLLGTPLILLAVTRPVVADPATVTNIGEDAPCFFVWGGFDNNIALAILLRGTGVVVESNNGRGNVSYHCHGQIDFGATVIALEFPNLNPVEVRLSTIEEACVAFPDACRGNGAFIGTFESTGIQCGIPGIGTTTKFSQRVTPGGQVQLTCHLPE